MLMATETKAIRILLSTISDGHVQFQFNAAIKDLLAAVNLIYRL